MITGDCVMYAIYDRFSRGDGDLDRSGTKNSSNLKKMFWC